MQKITPFLWFDDNAEEALNFYVATFKNAKILSVNKSEETGKLFTGSIEIEGMTFGVLNGGPMFKFTEAISFMINCETQEEIDNLWHKLTADGGQESQCGWLKDKFGVSWQVIPSTLSDLISGDDEEGSGRAMAAMMKMGKIDIAELKKAYAGE